MRRALLIILVAAIFFRGVLLAGAAGTDRVGRTKPRPHGSHIPVTVTPTPSPTAPGSPTPTPVLSSAPTPKPKKGKPADAGIEPDEIAVWQALLVREFADEAKMVALVSHTATDSNRKSIDLWRALNYLRIEYPELSLETREDFEGKNAGSETLPRLTGRMKTEIVEWKPAPLTMNEWNRFHAIHPEADALVILSRAGINRAGDQALVYFEYACGNYCGGGEYRVFRRETSRAQWLVDHEYKSWSFADMWTGPAPVDSAAPSPK